MKSESSSPFSQLGNPAHRALANAGVISVKELSAFTEKEIIKLHGMGKASIPLLKNLLQEVGLYSKS